jgi:hypothetical protein
MSSLLPLWDGPPSSKAAASCAHSKRFALCECALSHTSAYWWRHALRLGWELSMNRGPVWTKRPPLSDPLLPRRRGRSQRHPGPGVQSAPEGWRILSPRAGREPPDILTRYAPMNLVKTRSIASLTLPLMNGTRWNASLPSSKTGPGAGKCAATRGGSAMLRPLTTASSAAPRLPNPGRLTRCRARRTPIPRPVCLRGFRDWC